VHNSLFVRSRESLRDAEGVLDRAPHGQWTRFELLPQRLSFKQLSDQERCTVVRADVVDSKLLIV
jgi:hypothetical protein